MSHVHHPDGRLRLAATLVVSVAAALTTSLASLLVMLSIALLVTIFVAAKDRALITNVSRRLLRVNAFLSLVWITTAITWRDAAIDTIGALFAMQMTLRVNIVTLAATLLLMRMSGVDLGRAAVGLGLPTALGALLAQLVRQVALLSETKTRLERAMRARAYRPAFGFRSLHVSAQLVAWLIIHALARSERLSLGLRARGMNSLRWPIRTSTAWRALPKSDWSILAVVMLIVGLCSFLPRLGIPS